MADWVLPHLEEQEPAPVVDAATAKAFPWKMPHLEPAPTKPLNAEQAALAGKSKLGRVAQGAGQKMSDIGSALKQKAGMVANVGVDAANWAAALAGLTQRPTHNEVLGGAPEAAPLVARSTWPQEAAESAIASRPAREAIAGDSFASVGSALPDVALGMLARKPGLVSGALTGAGIEAVTRPLENPTWGNVAKDTMTGAVAGSVGGGLMQGIMSGAGKLVNARTGNLANPEYARRLKLFNDAELPGSLGDITQHPTIMRAEDLAKIIPATGRNQFLANQAAQLSKVIEAAPERIAGAVASDTKEDLGKVMARSIKEKYAAAKNTARGLYDQVEADAAGLPAVQATGLAAETKALLSKYPGAFAKITDDPGTVSTLEAIAKGTSPSKSAILGADGQSLLKAPQLSFAEMRQLDSDLGAMIRQGRRLNGRGEYNDKTFAQLVKVQGALREDIKQWSVDVGSPQVAKGVAEANKAFREGVIPFRQNRTTRAVLQDENYDTDMLPNQMFKLNAPTRTQQSVGFLTPEGIQAGRYHLIKQAETRALDDATESGYSPSRFLRTTQLGESGPKVFTPEELEKVSDLRDLVSLSRRAASFAADPQNGSRMAGISAMMSPKLAGIGRLFSTISQSPKVMKYSLADPRFTGTAPRAGLGGLAQAAETGLRKSGIGIGVAMDPSLPERSEGNNSWK